MPVSARCQRGLQRQSSRSGRCISPRGISRVYMILTSPLNSYAYISSTIHDGRSGAGTA